ncbi:conserved hypothetical protein, partial [Trichinella spiralis]|uniref:hypothetical protein n=1 Tax=Trichinella spiralis TaxID=6334 RepID=UPI0001EFCCFD
MANMIFPYQLILHDLHRYELTQHWPFVTSVKMNLSRSTSAHRIFSNVSKLTSVQQRTQLTNKRFDPTYPTIRSPARDLLHFSSPCALR